MKITKTQGRVLLIMSIAVVVLFVVALLVTFLPKGDGANTGAKPIPHEKIRDARVSLSPQIEKELNLGGSGDETPVGVFTYLDNIYIFGNTTSADYDFDTKGSIFLAVITTSGRTAGFYKYGEVGSTLIKAELCESGYLLAVNTPDERACIMTVNFKGELIATQKFSNTFNESFDDLFVYESEVVAVTHLVNEATRRASLKVRIMDKNLSTLGERVTERNIHMEYVKLFPHTSLGYVVAANIVDPLVQCMTFITLGLSSPIGYNDVDMKTFYRAGDVIPYEYGYIAVVIDADKQCDIAEITQTFSWHSTIQLKQSAITEAQLFYAPDGYYCLMRRGVDVTTMMKLDASLHYQSVIADFATSRQVSDQYIYSNSSLFCSTSINDISLIIMKDGEKFGKVSYGGKGMSDVKAVKAGGRFITVGTSSQKTDDCPVSFGKKDLWVAYLNAF